MSALARGGATAAADDGTLGGNHSGRQTVKVDHSIDVCFGNDQGRRRAMGEMQVGDSQA
jgi:hypothetical protein